MANNFFKKNNSEKQFRVNDEIRNYDTVRLIYKPTVGEGFNKVVSLDEAKRMASDKGLDLIEINTKASPVILRLEEYSKYIYELKKQAKQKRKR